MVRLILASASPRRKELLSQVVTCFDTVPSAYKEHGERSARETARLCARGKAEDVFLKFPDCYVLGADTVVSLGDRILGKPKDAADARTMLRMLSGKTHSVYTGVCLRGKDFCKENVIETKVTFFDLDEAFIRDYVAGGSPMDKAGAYGIQDGGLVRSYEGSYTNVVGLPVEEVRALLDAAPEKLC